MKPRDFWALHPLEFHWIAEARRVPKMYGALTESEVADLYESTYGSI
jgi:hypothetical protein